MSYQPGMRMPMFLGGIVSTEMFSLASSCMSYHCNGDHRCAGKDEGNFLKLAVPTPLLG